jgi:hypothetical protein
MDDHGSLLFVAILPVSPLVTCGDYWLNREKQTEKSPITSIAPTTYAASKRLREEIRPSLQG